MPTPFQRSNLSDLEKDIIKRLRDSGHTSVEVRTEWSEEAPHVFVTSEGREHLFRLKVEEVERPSEFAEHYYKRTLITINSQIRSGRFTTDRLPSAVFPGWHFGDGEESGARFPLFNSEVATAIAEAFRKVWEAPDLRLGTPWERAESNELAKFDSVQLVWRFMLPGESLWRGYPEEIHAGPEGSPIALYPIGRFEWEWREVI